MIMNEGRQLVQGSGKQRASSTAAHEMAWCGTMPGNVWHVHLSVQAVSQKMKPETYQNSCGRYAELLLLHSDYLRKR